MAHFAGLVAGKVFTGEEDPVPFAHVVTTTTHKSLRGPRGGMVLATEEYAPSVDRGCPLVLGGPLSHVMAAKAVALAEARTAEFRAYAQAVADNAKALAEGLLSRGVNLVTGGTDNHIVLLDVNSFGLTGRQAEAALLESGIVTNRNSVPNDPNGAWYTSGVRVGTPALTSRGFTASDMDAVADLIAGVLRSTTPTTTSAGAPSKAKYDLSDDVRQSTLDGASALVGALQVRILARSWTRGSSRSSAAGRVQSTAPAPARATAATISSGLLHTPCPIARPDRSWLKRHPRSCSERVPTRPGRRSTATTLCTSLRCLVRATFATFTRPP